MDVQNILHTVNAVLANVPWSAVAASGLLSPVLLAIKKWFSVQSERVMISLVALSGMLVAGGSYLLHVPTHDPTIIALQGAAIAFGTQPFYFFIVKPIAASVEEQLAKAAAFERNVKSAAEPAVTAGPDFSS
jgi:hypothetical protein